ncbi:MAG: 50S ribosomal protein L13 [Candidatus Colwellbacteria bacterium]|nr:50S ribosomal protein L13 [Candidatus Colwellbacteria bacterium]
MTNHTIDAKNKTLGRLATHIANLLQDKNLPSYAPHKEGGNKVVVKNVHLLKVTGKKATQKVYKRYSGRPGNLKEQKFVDVFSKTPERVLFNAVKGMLPKNRLLVPRLKRLVIETKDNG